ncbi:MAG: M15 family metallopeptidase [Cyanobacteria bacterium P01_F01_bin.13]
MAHFTDDIPEARRERLVTSVEPAPQSSSGIVPWLLVAIAVLGLGGVGIWWLSTGKLFADGSKSSEPLAATSGSAVAAEPAAANATSSATDSATETADAGVDALETSEASGSNRLLGHRPYSVADTSNLVTISTNSMVKLKPEVAQKVETMMAEARAVGVSLDVISGFRTLEDQRYLFFDLKAERGQTTQTRAEVSAPPGYSEHHTGYAVDFIDISQPATELNTSFENTPAFRWLEENAAYYGFEISFPKDSKQNVAYEPWHWRYVGNQESLELFYQD